MKRNVRAALVFCLCLLLGVAAYGQSVAPAKPARGIKVHGYWNIDVKNPDGTLADHREFENALVTPYGGDAMLSQLLLGSLVPGDFSVIITGANLCGNTPCMMLSTSTGPTNHYNQCTNNSVVGTYLCTYGLAVNYVAATATTPAGIVLFGNLTATGAGTITAVGTGIGSCPAAAVTTTTPPTTFSSKTTAPNCAAYTGTATVAQFLQFTATTLPAAGVSQMQVNAGQLVQITVTIGFS